MDCIPWSTVQSMGKGSSSIIESMFSTHPRISLKWLSLCVASIDVSFELLPNDVVLICECANPLQRWWLIVSSDFALYPFSACHQLKSEYYFKFFYSVGMRWVSSRFLIIFSRLAHLPILPNLLGASQAEITWNKEIWGDAMVEITLKRREVDLTLSVRSSRMGGLNLTTWWSTSLQGEWKGKQLELTNTGKVANKQQKPALTFLIIHWSFSWRF